VSGQPAGRRTSSFARPAADLAREAKGTEHPIVDCPSVEMTRDAGSAVTSGKSDPLIVALIRYVEALDRRYPDGPDQMRREALDRRANMPEMSSRRKRSAA
jgi:hypothetical protein